MKICFITKMPTWSSAIMRGHQMAEFLNKFEELEAVVCDFRGVKKHLDADFFVFCKFLDRTIARLLHKRGKKIIWDIIEYDKNFIPDALNDGYLDAVITTNNYTTEVIKRRLSLDKKPLLQIIPHHSSNFDNVTIPKDREIKTLGYIGILNQFEGHDLMLNFCNSRGLVWNPVGEQSHQDDKFPNLVEDTNSLDIGVIFLNPHIHEAKLKYKSNVKFTNMLSHGVPVITVPYQSYKEVDPEYPLFVADIHRLLAFIENLTRSPEYHKEMSEYALKISKPYHINNICKQYLELFTKCLKV